MRYKIALAQTLTNPECGQNLKTAERLTAEAAAKGAELIVFPEVFLASFPENAMLDEKLKAAHETDSPAVDRMRKAAADNGIWMIFGMYEPASERKNFNTTIVADDKGLIRSVYHKTHLYDAFNYLESDFNAAGDKLFEPIDTPFCKLGLMVCYELRFPEIARHQALNGADIIIVPAAWSDGEGKLTQLELLTRSRALENTVFVAMCDMGRERVGNSMVVDPLGNVIVRAGREEELLIAEIDTKLIEKTRRTVPSLANRRPELYI
ncbi:MAG: carbon-nitrogen hydrolase family protein [Lachnospiraceae bacterium]|nr:carbon-nitrogen hydrolase family protein [Lachnospiraceae bacterium]